MKIALCLLAIMTLGQAEPCYKCKEIEDCEWECPIEDKEGVFICLNTGDYGKFTRCKFNCFYKVHGTMGSDKEVECKPGHFPYCWNNECGPQDKGIPEGGKSVCDERVVKGKSFPTVCHLKCFFGRYNQEANATSCEKLNETYEGTWHGDYY